MNRGRPIATLARFAKWQIQSRVQEEVIFHWFEGAKLAVRNGMTGATGNIYCGLHEYRDMAFLLHLLDTESTFVDVGANVGSYTILASAVCQARSIAIEPDENTAKRLVRNIEVNGIDELVDLRVTAVGASNGNIKFTRGRDTINRVASGADEDVQIVPLVRLDDLLEGSNPTLIKVDVEGFETEVLKGSERTLSNASLKAILLETVNDEARQLLASSGFNRVDYNPLTRKFSGADAPQSPNSLYVRDPELLEKKVARAATRVCHGLSI